MGFEGEILFDDSKPDGMLKKKLDVDVSKRFGWTAKTPFLEGIQKTYSFYLDLLK